MCGPKITAPDFEVLQARLTERQREVLALLALGKTNREIAEELVLSERSAERYIGDLCSKLGARNRTEAVAYALGKPSAS